MAKHSKDTYFSYDGVELAGPTAAANGIVQSLTWPIDYAEHDTTVLGISAERMDPGLEKAAEIALTVLSGSLAASALIAKRAVTGKTAIYGPEGNGSGKPKYVADDCFVRNVSPAVSVNNILTHQVTIRIAGPGADNVGTLVTTFA